MKNNNLDSHATDLLNFCGGSNPTKKDLEKFLQLRNLTHLSENSKQLLLQTAEAFNAEAENENDPGGCFGNYE
jgi:hypothetical protein